jgi:hypothetical protein
MLNEKMGKVKASRLCRVHTIPSYGVLERHLIFYLHLLCLDQLSKIRTIFLKYITREGFFQNRIFHPAYVTTF